MNKKRKTLRRSIFIGTTFFILLLCAALNIVHFHTYKRTLYSDYEMRIEDILRYAAEDIDADDLAECMRTGVKSEKYNALQTTLDRFRDRMDIHFIYIIEPLNTQPVDNIRHVIAGVSKYEYENDADELVELNMLTGDSYSPETAAKYLNAYLSGELSFFEERSEWGVDYTGLLPLRDSGGNLVAALCVDIDAAEIYTKLRISIISGILLVLVPGLAFVLGFVFWSKRNITEPVEKLGNSAMEFVSRCRDQRDPEALKIDIPVKSGNGEISTLAGAVSEMSEAMQEYVKNMVTAENAARDAETIAELKESITALLDNMPGLHFSKNAETGVYLACNQAFADYAHKPTPGDVAGLTDMEIFDPVTAQHFVDDDKMALSMDEPYIFYEDVPDAAGSPRRFRTTKLKFIDSAGQLCLLGMCEDVTDPWAQIQANRMITAMAADYRCVYYINLDENDAVCYRGDPSDSDRTPVGVHFPYLERFTYYANNYISDMYREGFLSFINPDKIRERLATQPIIAYRYLAKGKDNKEYYEMIRAAGVRRAEERDDHMVHAIGLGLTKIDAEMRETMAKNEALAEALTVAEEASKAKTAFLSNMSHEIRTPMNAIIGLDTLALHDENLSAQTREYLEKIGNSARHLLSLINDILDMSRIESGRIMLRKEEFSFSSMLEQINTMVMSQCSDKNLHYECHFLSRVDDYYIGDDMKLKQVLINILGNAVKFTPVPGSVTFTVEQVQQYESYCTLRFIIKDTGIGMSKEFIPKIFEAFSQEESGTANKYGSTGLGMAITKNIVSMMNGDIVVDSEKGAGTTFTVTVTLSASSHSAHQTYSNVLPENLRVLFVDDDPVASEHAMIVANAIGVQPEMSTSAGDALNRVLRQRELGKPYHILITDYKMPDMNGIELTKAIRAVDRGETPIIILTGCNSDDIQAASKQYGVDGILSKPLFNDTLLHEIQHVLHARGFITEEPEPMPGTSDEETQERNLAGLHVLIAEDMEINAEILIDLLEMEGVTSEHAENGQAAIDLFNSQPEGHFDAIFMDMRMPVMDGLTATRVIRELDRPDAKTIPIIAMTANAFEEDVQRSLQAGLNAHLSKPVEPERLYETLEQMVRPAH